MSFASPLLLLGLLAALIPVAIHLFHRRKAVRRPFPAIAFLLQSQRRIARGLRVRQMVLLALRIALFVLVPLAMAQPWLDCSGGTGDADAGDARLPATVVIVLDESASLSVRAGRGTLWDVAVDRALRTIDDLRPWDRVAVVFAGAQPESPWAEPSEDRGRVRDAIRNHVPAWGGGDLVEALQVAAELHARSDLPEQRTIVLTDGSAHAWPGDGVRSGVGRLQVVDLLGDTRPANHAVESITWEPAGDMGPGAWRIDVAVRRSGDADARAVVTLEVGDVVVGTEVADLQANAQTVVSFSRVFDEEGVVPLRARVEDPTGLEADDVREAPMVLGRAVRALLVNGDARSVAMQDELFFLERALEVTVDGPGAVEVTTRAPGALSEVALESMDVVVLANVAALPASEVDRLRLWVEQGGGLWFTVGSQTDPERWNQTFGNLLPKPIRDIKLLSERYDPDAAIKVTRIGAVDTTHPIFRVFGRAGGESLQSVAAYRYVLLEPGTREDVRTIASFRDGGPALLERDVGRGRTLLWTTTIDVDWTDLPIRTAYVPFVRRTVDHLARRAGSAGVSAEPGRPVELPVEVPGLSQVAVLDPEGRRTVLDVDDGRARFTPTRRGIHRVVAGADTDAPPIDELAFVVVAPRAESDLAPVDPARIAALREAGLAGVAPSGAGGLPPGRRDLWPVLLLIAMLVLYAETLVAVRRRLWEKVAEGVRKARR